MEHNLTQPEEELHNLSSQIPLSEINSWQGPQHLTTGFSSNYVALLPSDNSLPYSQIGGAGLERLCYLLLLAQGYTPRYFGKPGQKQYGIDLLVTEGDKCTVFQCKNVQDFSDQQMEEALQLFEKEWLGRPALPQPERFVLCCPLSFRERKKNESWTALEGRFYQKTGVKVSVWDLEFLNEKLRYLPDVVADLFSDEAVELFCELKDWNQDLFRPVVSGSGELTIERYLEKDRDKQIFVNPKIAKEFERKLERHSSLLIYGLPGSGKTLTALALASSMRQGSFRTFYINMLHEFSEDDLVRGIKRRLTRPTIFLLDDCQGKYEILESTQNRCMSALAGRRHKGLLVYIARTTPTPKGLPRGDFSNFVETLKQAEATLEFRTTAEMFFHVITLARPDLGKLSKTQLEKIFEFTGHDLFLLDQLLEVLSFSDKVDYLKPEELYEVTLKRYFSAPTVYRPGYTNLAALAQFDIAPAVSSFPTNLEHEDPKAAAQLLVIADRPPCYFFLHSSAAELIFRALMWNSGIDAYAETAVGYLVNFFKERPQNDPKISADLSSVLKNRLKLSDSENEQFYLKSLFLDDDAIYSLIERDFAQLPLDVVTLCLQILASTNSAKLESYRDCVQRRIADGTMLQMIIMQPSWQFLAFIKTEYPTWYADLRNQFTRQGLRLVIQRKEGMKDLLDLLPILGRYSALEDFLSGEMLDAIPDDEFDEMMQRTIKSKRSINNISWSLRELKKKDVAFLETLERKLGVKNYLTLIINSGTFFELLRVLENSSPYMVRELIAAADDQKLDILIDKTIASRRSIGNLHWVFRDLKMSNPNLLLELEQKVGVQRYMRLIVESGTIIELFRAIQNTSLDMAEAIIEATSTEMLNVLIDRMIVSGRSAGTLDLTLRELKKHNFSLVEQLERKLNVPNYLRLIVSNGTFFELLMTARRLSPSVAEELIAAADDQTLDILIDKTIVSGRSIGTLSFALRDLGKGSIKTLIKLERATGTRRWWKLILASGNLKILSSILAHMSTSFRFEMAKEAQALPVDAWNDLLRRGDFTDLAIFIRWASIHFTGQFTLEFLSKLKPIFEEMLRDATWERLNKAAWSLSDAAESEFKNYLQCALKEQLKTIELSSLHFDSFSQATYCISCLWQVLETERPELADLLFAILPEAETWYADEQFLRSARTLLHTLTRPIFKPDDAHRVMSLCNSSPVSSLFTKETTLDIFLYLWNLYGLWFKLKQLPSLDVEQAFISFVNAEIRTAVNNIFRDRFQTREDEKEALTLIVLCGFMHASGLTIIEPAEGAEWSRRMKPFDELLAKLIEMESFIQSAFFLIGLSCIFGKEANIPQSCWRQALSKISGYTKKTEAVNNLYNLISSRIS